MDNDKKLPLTRRIRNRLSQFFDDIVYTDSLIEQELHSGDIIFKPLEILPFLQTALMDNKFVEVEMNGITQIYFSRIHDHPPEASKNAAEELNDIDVDYSPGDYLKDFTHLIVLPLEPGMGNFNIRYSNRLVLRFFTSSYAVELGTFFQEQTTIQDLPVLRLDYPTIGRIVRGSREYRAKVPKSMNLELEVTGKRRKKSFTTSIINMSVSGFAFSITKEQQNQFIIDEQRSMEIFINGVSELKINGKIRHISKIRGREGTEFMCGFQADLVTRAVAAKLEEIVATVQRAHLREIAELSMESGIELLR